MPSLGIQINKYPFFSNTPNIKAKHGIDSFSISYDIAWDSVSVYGRQDPIQQYQTTGEVLSVTFPLLSGDKGIGDYTNLAKLTETVNTISQLARPIYNKIYKGVQVINTSPLIELFIMNTDWNLIGRNTFARNNTSKLWGGKIYIIAPTNINIDFGDRSRTISSFTEGGATLGPGFGPELEESLPKKCLVTLSGPIISTEIKYAINTNKFEKEQVAAAAAAANVAPANDAAAKLGNKIDAIVGAQEKSLLSKP